MKFRMSFVTNSSSSSYVCDICGAEQSGMDMDLGLAGMFRCANDHAMCECHANYKKVDKKIFAREEIESSIEMCLCL